jgi:hypothetical protein
MSLLKALSKRTILGSRTVHLLGQLLEKGCFCSSADQAMQNFRNVVQLLKAFQSTPEEGFATFTVDRISHGGADLALDRHQLRISGSSLGQKRGDSSGSCGTLGNPPSD